MSGNNLLSREGATSPVMRFSERERAIYSLAPAAMKQTMPAPRAERRARRTSDSGILAGATGLEPATSCVTGGRSNQLNYVDFGNLELRVRRSIWHQVVGNCKTEASAKPVPMDSYMAEDLLRWRRQSTYTSDDDYAFASETMRGKQPYWLDNLMKRHIRPVAKAIGINKNIGWHTFRHSFGTLLKANGEYVKTVQELLRHANSRITLDVYTQAVNSNKRATQSKVVRMMVSSAGTKVVNVGTTDSTKQAQNAG